MTLIGFTLYCSGTVGAGVGWVCNYNCVQSVTFVSENRCYKDYKKLTFPLWGVVRWWKNALEGVKFRLLMKFFKISHVIYHSMRNLMLITKGIESRVWKFSRKKLHAQQSNLFNGVFLFFQAMNFFLKSIHTNFCAKNWAYQFYHARSMETKFHTM